MNDPDGKCGRQRGNKRLGDWGQKGGVERKNEGRGMQRKEGMDERDSWMHSQRRGSKVGPYLPSLLSTSNLKQNNDEKVNNALSVESQKGISLFIDVPLIENQKGVIAVQSLWR